MLPNRPSGMCGTPVPKRDVELRSKGSGPVITYRLSPEELKEYLQHLNDPVKREKPFMFPRKTKKEESAMAELTKEEYLRLRLEGKNRTEIMRKYFPTTQHKFYRLLKEWGIREMEDETKELARLKNEVRDLYRETAEKMFSLQLQPEPQPEPQQEPQQERHPEPHPDAIIAELDQLLAEKTARIRELEETVNRLEAELDAERAVLLSTIEKAVDDSAPGQADHDPVSHPAHYTAGKVECIDAIESATVGLTGGAAYCTGDAIKYLWRWHRKGGVEDLKKARWYIDRLIKMAGNEERSA